MYYQTEEAVRSSLENTDKIVVANNAIYYGNTIYQIRNITSVDIKQWEYLNKDKMPGHVLLAWIALGGFLLAITHILIINVLAIVIIASGWLSYFYSRVSKVKYTYSLMIELNSGSIKYFFQYDSKKNMEKVVRKLQELIEKPYFKSEFVIHNSQTYNFMENRNHTTNNNTSYNNSSNSYSYDNSSNNYSYSHDNSSHFNHFDQSMTIADSVLAIGNDNSIVSKSDRSIATGSVKDSIINTGDSAHISRRIR